MKGLQLCIIFSNFYWLCSKLKKANFEKIGIIQTSYSGNSLLLKKLVSKLSKTANQTTGLDVDATLPRSLAAYKVEDYCIQLQ